MSREVTIHLGFDDYLAANWLQVRRRWIWRGTFRFLLLLTPIYAGIGVVTDGLAQGSLRGLTLTAFLSKLGVGFCLACAVLAGLALYWLWCIPRSAKKLYSQNPSANTPYQFSFNSSGLKTIGKFQTADLPWSHIHSWLESNNLILLQQTPLTFFCLPKSQLGDENVTELKSVLVSAAVKNGV